MEDLKGLIVSVMDSISLEDSSPDCIGGISFVTYNGTFLDDEEECQNNAYTVEKLLGEGYTLSELSENFFSVRNKTKKHNDLLIKLKSLEATIFEY